MKTIIFLALGSVLLSGCGAADRAMSQLTGNTKVCVDGVTYLQFPSGVTPQYNIDGKLVECR